MSQHDFEISQADANTGATVRAAINAALQALASNNSGSGDPAIMYGYEFKFHTGESPVGFYVRKGDNSAWVKAGYVDATTGQLKMLNADAATKALQDNNGLQIDTGYAKLAAANTFTAAQTTQIDTVQRVIKAATAGYLTLVDQYTDQNGTPKGYVGYDKGVDSWSLFDAVAASSFRIGINDGKVTLGTVPLARMGTVDASGTQACSANTTYSIALTSPGASAHAFYLCSAYTDGTNVFYGAGVTETETIWAQVHTGIRRQSAGNADFQIINGGASSVNIGYKVYKLTET